MFPCQIENWLKVEFFGSALTAFFLEVGACGPNGWCVPGTSAEP
jgi:hypothetical protein